MFASLASLRDRAAARFSSADRGATAVEYGLLVGLIAVGIIAAVLALGGQLEAMFESVTTELERITGGGAAVDAG